MLGLWTTNNPLACRIFLGCAGHCSSCCAMPEMTTGSFHPVLNSPSKQKLLISNVHNFHKIFFAIFKVLLMASIQQPHPPWEFSGYSNSLLNSELQTAADHINQRALAMKEAIQHLWKLCVQNTDTQIMCFIQIPNYFTKNQQVSYQQATEGDRANKN